MTEMLDETHYVPVLRWKSAEKGVLQWLRPEDKSRMMPLLEIIPRTFRTKDNKKGLSVRSVLSKIAREIEESWGSSPVFVDVEHAVRAGLHDPGGSHLLEVLAQETRNLLPLFSSASNLVPVTGLSRSEGCQKAVSSIIEADQTGACFRISTREVSDPKFADNLVALLGRLKLDVADVDLLVDYQVPNGSDPDLKTLCLSLPQLSKWRSFIVLIGAFPKDLQKLEKNCEHTLPRDDWLLWRDQIKTLPGNIRRPTFGDYTIQHPIYREPPENSNPSASIRYTHSEYWVVMRGEGLKNEDGPGHEQYLANAQLLCDRDEFCGAGFSRSDRYILETSQQPDSPGNPHTWLRAGINHHMTFATRQVVQFAEHLKHSRTADSVSVGG